jgi:uncharacterized protein (TIGR03382 family)
MHKSSRIASGLGLCGALVAGCVETPDLGANRDDLTYEQWKATLYREPSGMYVLDGDTVLRSEERLYEVYAARQSGQLAVYTMGGADIKWSPTQKLALTYCVSNNFGANKAAVVTALSGAAEGGWEMFADVDFKYVPAEDANCTAANPNVLFDVNPVNAQGQYLARAFFPDSPRGDRNILIDPSSFDPQLPWPLRNIIAHEMGHTLGFRHEHIRPEANAPNCAEDTNFRGLTPYDRASVMHYPQCNGNSLDLAFTTVDQTGVAALYGAPAPNMVPMAEFNAPSNGATVPPTFPVRTQIVDTDLVRVELWVDGAMQESTTTITTGQYDFTVTDHPEGPATVEIKAYDARQQVTTRTVSVTVRIGGGGGSGGGDGDGDGNADDITGGCSTGGGAGSLSLLGLALGALFLRRNAARR